jgi:hypothetical protein
VPLILSKRFDIPESEIESQIGDTLEVFIVAIHKIEKERTGESYIDIHCPEEIDLTSIYEEFTHSLDDEEVNSDSDCFTQTKTS